MSQLKNLRGPCEHCRGTIEYAAERIGTACPCPHCGKITELRLEQLPEEPAIPRRIWIWIGVAVCIVALGMGAIFYALKRAQDWAEKNKARKEQPSLSR